MKKSSINEKNFEVAHVAQALVDNGYMERLTDNYQQELLLDTEILIDFITSTQPKEWEKLKEQYPANTEEIFLKRVSSEIGKRGTLDVLRNGVKDRGAKFELAYFKPVSGLNPEHELLYSKNKFSLIRQIPFSQKYQKTLDISIFLNGIPIITSELKNHFTGQDYTDAIRQYKFDRQLKEQGGKVKALVAFTGTVKDDVHEFTEANMNGFPESQTVGKFDTDEYRIMIVAHKFQTGFDQPLLQTMYVDKKLKSVNAVQTLSRLNRISPGKDRVFVLDFVNETDEIKEAFQPYYETTILSEGIDPNVIYQSERGIDKAGVIDPTDIEQFVDIWYSPEDQSKLHQVLSPSIERFKKLTKEDRYLFRDNLRRYVHVYAFITQMVTFADVSLEKLYLYCRFLLKKLPFDKDTLPREIVESIDMDRYRIKQTYKGGITLEKKDGEIAPFVTDEKKPPVQGFDRLSAIIEKINEIGGTPWTKDDKVKFTKLAETISIDEEFKESMKTNTRSNLKLLFMDLFDKTMANMYESDLNFYKKIDGNSSIKELIKDNLFDAMPIPNPYLQVRTLDMNIVTC